MAGAMTADELQAALHEVERFEKAGFFLKAVAALRSLANASLPADDIHRIHLRLADLYRREGLLDEANREVLAVAGHWNDEGRTLEARDLLACAEGLLPGGVAMLGDLPGDREAAHDALAALIDSLRAPRPSVLGDEPTPVNDDDDALLPGLKGSGKLPALPSSSTARGGPGTRGPRVPLPAAQADGTGDESARRSPLDEHIDRTGTLVQKDPSDVKARIKLAELLLKAGRTPDGIAHLVLAAVHYEKLGEPHRAVQLYKRVLEVAPERRELHSRLGDIYTHLGLLAEAATEYKKAEQKQP